MASSRAEYHHLIPKPRTKSQVWTHFGLPANEQGIALKNEVGICKICFKSVSAKGGNTTNLLSHIKVHHPMKYREIELSMKRLTSSTIPSSSFVASDPDNLPTAVEPSYKIQKTMMVYQPLDKNTDKICTQGVTEFLATTMQPYNIVEHVKFINMLNILNPLYKLPGRKYFSGTAVPKLYNETVEKIRKILSEVSETEVSITSDCWTSIANTPFLSITVHFISPDWELVSACLSCKHFDSDHTAVNISEVLTDTMSEWGIDMKNIFFCVTDNGKSIKKAVEFLDVPHLSCFADNINIGVNKALDLPELKKAVAHLKRLQRSIAHSWKMKRDLGRAQDALNMEQVDLPSACPTTWWSTAKLCNRYIQNQLSVSKMLLQYPAKRYLILDKSEVAAIEDFISAISLLEDMTKTLSGSTYLTASSVLPLYVRIKKDLAHGETDSGLLKKIKSEILKPLNEKYHETSMALELGISTFCDPGFRMKFLESPNDVKQAVIKKIADMNSSFELNSTQSVPVSKKEKKGLAKFLDFDEDVEEETGDDDATTNEKKAVNELNEYLSMPKLDYNDCPLLWWKVHRLSFPSLELLARKYLAIPGTSVPSERVFSSGGSVITKQRASLKPKNAEMQIFLAQNIKFV